MNCIDRRNLDARVRWYAAYHGGVVCADPLLPLKRADSNRYLHAARKSAAAWLARRRGSNVVMLSLHRAGARP